MHLQKLKLAALLACCAVMIIGMTACSPSLRLNQKYAHDKIKINYGTKVSRNIGEYIDLDRLSEEDRDYVLEHSKIEYNGKKEPGRKYDQPGIYDLTIFYEGQQYRKYEVTVTDTEAPTFTKAKDVYVFSGMEIYDEDIDTMIGNMFAIKDNSPDPKLKITHDKIRTDHPKDYTIHATATDKYGNKSEKTAVFHVQKAEYGAKGTYVYVSIPKQTMTFFVDGKADLTSPVVTGTQYAHDTPRGVFYINYKGIGVRLKGETWDVTVDYWLAFVGSSIGLHSAQWRGSFGGDIYTYNGSHGCVNLPTYVAAELYEKAEIGTPVIVGD